ncbi:unnamed protein product [Durusdinium trenchii]|uniref:Pre-mRNA-processing factor 19 n=1 Tax=Durusdinium trenchii TaxID=1381693 RepID=A0ABP0SHS9_9DINO
MSTIVCAISGQAAQEPVFSPKTKHVYEKGLIEKQIETTGKCPVTKEELTKDDLVSIKGNTAIRPRPATAASIPGMLTLLQSEWDALMSETFELKSQLDTGRKQLSHALYQHDAACRVIARLIRERDMVKAQNQKLQEELSSAPLSGAIREDADTGITPEILQKMKELADSLSKTRKQKHFPDLNPLTELKKFKCVGTHPIHKSTEPGILCVDVHKTEQHRVVTGGVDTQVVLFDSEKGGLVQKLTGHAKKVTSVCLHPTKDVVVSGSSDASAKVWTCTGPEWTAACAGDESSLGEELNQYTCAHTVRKHQAEVTEISIHPLGDYFLTTALDKSWAMHDLHVGRCVKHLRGLETSYPCMKWHPDGMILAAGTQGHAVDVWDIKEQKVVATLTGHQGSVEALSFSGNGYYLATGSKDGTVKLWDLRKPLNIQTLQLESPVNTVAFDTTGQYLSVGAEVVQIYNFASKSSLTEAVTLKDHGDAVMGVCFSQHARSLATVSMDRTLKIFRA